MTEKIYWIAVDFDYQPTSDQLESIAASLQDNLEHEVIVSSKEIEPMGKEEVLDYLEGKLEELE